MSRADRELRAAIRETHRNPPVIDYEAVWQGCRYVIHAWRDGELVRVAEADDHASLGLALVTMAEDNREAELPAEMFGIRDAWNRRWISIPFLPRDATPF